MPASTTTKVKRGPRSAFRAKPSTLVRRFVAVPLKNRDNHDGIDPRIVEECRVPAGSVLLFTQDLKPIEPANDFLAAHCRRKQPKTQRAYAEDLAHWWTYLLANDLSWEKVNRVRLDLYGKRLDAIVSRKTGLKLTDSTKARRVGTVELFYLWAYRRDMLGRPLLELAPDERTTFDRRSSQYANAARYQDGTKKSGRRTDEEEINPFTLVQLTKVIDKLGPAVMEPWDNTCRSTRDRLIAEVSLYTGMRVEEICALTVAQVMKLRPTLSRADEWTQARLKLLKTKGGGTREVPIHAKLWRMLVRYYDNERHAVLTHAREEAEKRKGRFVDPAELFVNGMSANLRDMGKGVKPDTVTRNFSKAMLACGLTREVDVHLFDPSGAFATDADGRERWDTKVLPLRTFHNLRHTYAVNWYRIAVKLGTTAPLKRLQALLGHKHMDTTADIYLKFLDIDEVALSDGYARILEEQINALAR